MTPLTKDQLFNPAITHHEELDTPDGQDLIVITHWADGADLQQLRKGMGSKARAVVDPPKPKEAA